MPTIRLATLADLEQVVALRLAFLQEMRPDILEHEPRIEELTREYVEDKLPKGEFLVWFAEEDGQIVGTSGMVFFHRPPTPGYFNHLHAYILNMYTAPEWRGKGVATMLMNHMIEYVRSTSSRRITLHASEMGRPVYERLGFKATNDEMVLKL